MRVEARFLFFFAWLFPAVAAAAEYHVAKTGDDANAGTSDKPWKTIQKAATTMQPGDTATVHAGTYREWVNPARGGTSDAARIVYRAAAGEQVLLKGSEAITTWTQEAGVWKAVVPNTTFGTFNPYTDQIRGSYLTYGSQYHLGDVYYNGEPYLEATKQADLSTTAKTWFAQVDATNTTLWANFGADNPNTGLSEINVRKYVFSPSTPGIGYITLDGFVVSQGSPNWAPPDAPTQEGMITTNWGLSWIVQNNTISDGKTVCLCSGNAAGGGAWAIDRVGHHVVRNNAIRRCGEAGIAGSKGWVASLIEGNLIEEINPARHFGGYESAGIKIHSAVDVVIKGNIIRRVHNTPGTSASHPGIWLDWQGQGSRITGNVIYDIEQTLLELEMDHGPTLVDNNIFVGNNAADTVWDCSENSVFVHNLFASAQWGFTAADGRSANYFTPHTTQTAGAKAHASGDNRYYNNVYLQKGDNGVSQAAGFLADYDVFYGGAQKSTWGDAHSVVKPFDAGFSIASTPNGVSVTWKNDSAPADVACPLITRDFIGIDAVTKEGIENHDGSPVTIDKDIKGAARSAMHPTAGPLEMLSGTNKLDLTAGPGAPLIGGGGGPGSVDGGGAIVVGSDGGVVSSGAGGASSTGSGGGAVSNGTGGDVPLDEQASETTSTGGCGCRFGVHSTTSSGLTALLLGLMGLFRRRVAKRHPCRHQCRPN